MKTSPETDNPLVLYVINASPAFIQKLDKERYDFVLDFQKNLPSAWKSNSMALLFYPDQVD